MSARSTLLDRTGDLRDRTADLVEAAGDARGRAEELYERRDEVVDAAAEASRRGRIQLWRALRALFGLLLVLPRLLLRAFSAGAEGLVAAVDRGERAREVGAATAERVVERARLAADHVPPARATRWRARRRAALFGVAAFGAGAGVGYLLATRDGAADDPSVVTVDADAASPNGHHGAPSGTTADLAHEGDDRG